MRKKSCPPALRRAIVCASARGVRRARGRRGGGRPCGACGACLDAVLQLLHGPVRACDQRVGGGRVAALDAYHELLAATSRLRTVLLRLLLPAPLLHPPSLDIMSNLSARGVDYWFWNRLHKAVHPPPAAAGDWRACSGPGVFHYSFIELWRPPCAAVAELATLMVTAQRRLARVLPLLRASSAALDVVCVAATRPRTWWPQFVSRRQPCASRCECTSDKEGTRGQVISALEIVISARERDGGGGYRDGARALTWHRTPAAQ